MLRDQTPQEALDTAVEHYANRSWAIYHEWGGRFDEYPEISTYMLILERACNAEIYDPDEVDPIDHAVGPLEPNHLTRLDFD